MAYPTFTANGSSTIQSNAAACTYTLPAHQAGDILFLVVETANEGTGGLTFTAGTGWAAVTGTPVGIGTAGGTSATALFVYWKRATSNAETNPTIADPGNHQAGNTFGVRGCIASGNPFDQISSTATGTTTSASIPALPANAVQDSIFFDIIATGADVATAQATFGAPNGNVISQSEAFDGATTTQNGGGVAYAWGYQGTPIFGLGATAVTLATANSWAGIKFSLKPAAPIVVAAGMASETDSAQGLGRVEKRAASLSTEADAAQALGRIEIRAIGLASESDTAFSLSSIAVAIGLASEVDTAFALAQKLVRAAGIATEADTALALGTVLIRTAGLAIETDTGLTLSRVLLRATGLATEADAALALSRLMLRPAGLSGETDNAQPLSSMQIRAAGLAVEGDGALGLTATSLIPTGLSGDVAAALGLSGRQMRVAGIASEADQGQRLATVQASATGMAAENDNAQGLNPVMLRTAGLSIEVSSAIAADVLQARSAGLAAEKDNTLAIAVLSLRAAGLASETDTAIALVPVSLDLVRPDKPSRLLDARLLSQPLEAETGRHRLTGKPSRTIPVDAELKTSAVDANCRRRQIEFSLAA